MSCAVMNCVHNESGECGADMIINETGYCETKIVDYDRCETCGALREEKLGELLEFHGHSVRQSEFVCPNCD